jgi:hypothetical protein
MPSIYELIHAVSVNSGIMPNHFRLSAGANAAEDLSGNTGDAGAVKPEPIQVIEIKWF